MDISLSGPLTHDLVCCGFDFVWVCDDVILVDKIVNINVIGLTVEYWSECRSFIGLKFLCSGVNGFLNLSLLFDSACQVSCFSDGFSDNTCSFYLQRFGSFVDFFQFLWVSMFEGL